MPWLRNFEVRSITTGEDAQGEVTVTVEYNGQSYRGQGISTDIRCDLRYDASPQPLRRSYVYVEPGKTEENAFRATRKWFSVVVEVTCKPLEKS